MVLRLGNLSNVSILSKYTRINKKYTVCINDKLRKYWKTSLVFLFTPAKKFNQEKLNNKKEFRISRFGKQEGAAERSGNARMNNTTRKEVRETYSIY